MTLTDELARRIPDRPYLLRWFGHREQLQTWPEGDLRRWVDRAARAVTAWAHGEAALSRLDRQEAALRNSFDRGELPLPEAAVFVTALYPEARAWTRAASRGIPDDADHRRALSSAWSLWTARRRGVERDRSDAARLPEFHDKLWAGIRKLADAESAVRGLLTDRDVGWDLDDGVWSDLNFAPLRAAADELAGEPALRRIAEILGRDWRSKIRPPDPPPPEATDEPEPGFTEIRGIRFGSEMAHLVSGEAGLLAFGETQALFFKKAAESELLVWDHFTPASRVWAPDAGERQKKNERGPMIVVLDTSGSMRGKPELVAKTAVLALLRVALEEDRACYLINFSSRTKSLDLSRVGETLPSLLRFLEFSFHGGTDLGPALTECVRVLEDGRFRDADVLVVSDFSVPKIAARVRRAVREQQDERGTRFYSLTVSVRPQNDFLNLFDRGWHYNIHPYQTNGISPESLG